MKFSKWVAAAALAVAASGLSALAAAAECEITINTGDTLSYDTTAINIDPACDEFTVHLTHTGKLAKNVMGHNWVLSKASDVNGIATDGMRAGLDKDYLKPDDDRVLAHTKVIGPGEEDSVTFSTDLLKEGEEYLFFCSFPGHFAAMRGTIAIAQ
jgi:azurin